MEKKNIFIKSLILAMGITFLASCTRSDTTKDEKTDSLSETQVISDSQYNNNWIFEDNIVCKLNSYTQSTSGISLGFKISVSEDAETDRNNFYIGHFVNDDFYFPAKLAYKITYSNNISEYQTTNIIKVNGNYNYDAVGDYLGQPDFSTYCDISCPANSKIDLDTVRLVNIFEADLKFNNENILIGKDPIKANNYYVQAKYDSTIKRYNLDDFVSFKFKGYSSFEDYTGINLECTFNSLEQYKKVCSRGFKEYQAGGAVIGTKINFSGSSRICFIMDDSYQGEKVIWRKILAGSSSYRSDAAKFDENGAIILDSLVGDFSTTFDAIDFKYVKDVKLFSISIVLQFFLTDTYKASSASGYTFQQRFGFADIGFADVKDAGGNVIKESNKEAYYVNGDLALIIVSIIFIAAYLSIDISAYFYLKEKNKNDEFKKMITSEYVKTSTIGFIFLGSLSLLITLIILRSSFMMASLQIYNPLDALIVVFGVISIILFGYFVKFFWTNFKARREKIRNERLKLNQNSIDDGTLIIKSK